MKSGVKTVVNTVDINRLRLDKDIYINLLNKYKKRKYFPKIENSLLFFGKNAILNNACI